MSKETNKILEWNPYSTLMDDKNLRVDSPGIQIIVIYEKKKNSSNKRTTNESLDQPSSEMLPFAEDKNKKTY